MNDTKTPPPVTRLQFPTLSQLEPLPIVYQGTVPAAYLDMMGHMNVRYYLALFDEAAWTFFERFGMDQAYYNSKQGGAFALQHFINYRAEVRHNDQLTIRGRMLGRSAKRVHFMLFMVNETQQKLAATIEDMGAHADLTLRRTSPFPPAIAAQIDALIAEHEQLHWQAPVCGVINP
ncbi:MAG: thioesterase family protein [Anaerolineales bacterium]|nr:thioesterase family protein [Anaerolineales bacterium]